MVRSCQAEQAIQDQFNVLVAQAQTQAQVGLLLGKQAVGSRDFILAAIPTPLREGQNPAQISGSAAPATASKAKKPGAASGSCTVVLDVDWIAQHASQLARMLPGGICILGTYLFCPDTGLQSAQPSLLNVLQELRPLLPPAASQELIVLHADSTTRKITARSAAPGATSLNVAELKWAPCIPNLMQVSCRWPLELSLPSPTATTSLQGLLDQLRDTAAASIRSSIGLLSAGHGDIPNPETLLLDLPAACTATNNQSAALPTLQVELLPLLQEDAPASDAGSKQQGQQGVAVSGQGTLRGWCTGAAVVHKRQKWSSTLQELKDHLCASLTARVDLLVEDALSWQDEQQQQAGGTTAPATSHPLLRQDNTGLRAPYIAALPHAVMLPLGPLPLYDYAMPGEGTGEVCGRVLELLGGATGFDEQQLEHKMVWLESEGLTSSKLGTWNPLAPPATVRALPVQLGTGSSSALPGQCTITVLGGAAMGAAVAVAGLAYMLGAMQM